MGFSFSFIVLLTICASCAVYALPVTESSPMILDAPEVAIGDIDFSVARKRELEDVGQGLPSANELPREANEAQSQAPSDNVPASLEGISISASTAAGDTVGYASNASEVKQPPIDEGQPNELAPRAKKSRKKAKKKGCHKTVKKVIQKTVPSKRENGEAWIMEERADLRDGPALEARIEETTQGTQFVEKKGNHGIGPALAARIDGEVNVAAMADLAKAPVVFEG